MNIVSINGDKIVDNLLNKNSLVIDLGCNQGSFARIILYNYNCNLIGYEPNDETCKKSLNKIKSKYPKSKFFYKALSNEKEVKLKYFYDTVRNNNSGISNNIFTNELDDRYTFVKEKIIETITLNEILKPHKKVDILKIDIESAEMEQLMSVDDNEIIKCDQISVEFHYFMKEYNIQLTDIDNIITRLKNLGFKAIMIRKKHPFILFIKKKIKLKNKTFDLIEKNHKGTTRNWGNTIITDNYKFKSNDHTHIFYIINSPIEELINL